MINITAEMVKKLRLLTNIGIMECKKALIEAQGDFELAINNLRKSGLVKFYKKYNKIASSGIILIKIINNMRGIMFELNCETDFVARNLSFQLFGDNIMDIIVNENIVDLDILRNRLEKLFYLMSTKFDENINIGRFIIVDGYNLGFYLHRMRIGAIVDSTLTDNMIIKYIAMHIVANRPKYITEQDIPQEIIDNERDIYMNVAMKTGKSENIIKSIVDGQVKKFVNDISLINQLFIMDTNKTIAHILSEHNARINNFICFEVGNV